MFKFHFSTTFFKAAGTYPMRATPRVPVLGFQREPRANTCFSIGSSTPASESRESRHTTKSLLVIFNTEGSSFSTSSGSGVKDSTGGDDLQKGGIIKNYIIRIDVLCSILCVRRFRNAIIHYDLNS